MFVAGSSGCTGLKHKNNTQSVILLLIAAFSFDIILIKELVKYLKINELLS